MPRKGANKKKKPTRPRCHTCHKSIYVPPGWSSLPAVRRHYWRHHPDVMRPSSSEKGR